jgi:hypothetical protein
MAHCTKKTKYNNGGLVARKEFKNIGSIEGNLSGNQGYRAGSVSASTKVGDNTQVTASKFKDSMGNSANNYSLEKQMKNNSSARLNKNSVSYSKGIGKGFTLKAEFNKNAGRDIAGRPIKNQTVMSISKPL